MNYILHWRSRQDLSLMSAILPELRGDGSWDAWFGHFQNVAAVNNWDDDAIKLRWLKARLTGRAQVTMQRLSKVTPGDFKTLTRGPGPLRARLGPG